MKKLEKGDKVTCDSQLWQGKIGRVVEVHGDMCRVCFGDLDFLIETEKLKIFDEVIKI
jgi:hypothetical protein